MAGCGRQEHLRRTPTPEQTEGPYYLDLDLVRSDIREDRPGLPLRLVIVVTDTGGERVGRARVDIWHCDALGVYSWDERPLPNSGAGAGAGLASGTFLRGRQLTDQHGRCVFETIYPGWYSGRSVHIHVKVQQASRMLTTQLYFPEFLTDVVHRQDPYRARPNRDTVNVEDAVFDGVGDATMLEPAKEGDACSAAITLVVPGRSS